MKSSFLLVAGNLGSTIALAATVLILARLLGPDQYGEYTLALVLPGAFQIATGFGLNTALIRYTAYNIARGDVETARRMAKSAILFLILIGALATAASFLGASFLSSAVLKRPELTLYVQVGSIFIIGQTFLQCVYAAFIGWSAAKYASSALVSQSFLKLLLSPTLVLIGFGVFGAVVAHVVSYVLVGAVFLGLLYATRIRGGIPKPGSVFSDLKVMVRYGFPEYVGRVLSQFSQLSYIVIILSEIALNSVVAYYQAALNVAATVALVASALTLALLPAFAGLDGVSADLKSAFSYAVKYVSYIMVPMVFFLLATSPLLVQLLYGSVYFPSSEYLNLLALSYIPTSLGLVVLPPFFNGIGRTRLTMAVLVLGAGTLFALAPIFGVVFAMGADGLIIALIISNVAQLVFGLYLAKKYSNVKMDYAAAARIFLVADLCWAVLLIPNFLSGLSTLPLFILDLVLFTALYFTLAPLLRILSREDFERLRASASELGLLRPLLYLILKYELLVLRLTSRTSASS